MAKQRPSVHKLQREQQKRQREQKKAEKAARKKEQRLLREQEGTDLPPIGIEEEISDRPDDNDAA